MVCAGSAVLFNLLILPRIGGRHLWRESETKRGSSLGILLYPVSILILLLAFHRRLEVVAAIWGILAFGDGMASLVGMSLGSRKLPWNPRKSWMGSLAFFLFGGVAATVLLQWTVPGTYSLAFAATVCGVTAAFAALLESMPQGLDDNIGVPLLSGLLLFCLVLTQGHWLTWFSEPSFGRTVAFAVVVNLILAGTAFALRGVDGSGMVGGFLIGFLVWMGLGGAGFSLLLAFFVLGTALTKLGYRRKAEQNLAQEKGGRRGARHALANGATAAGCAIFAATTPLPEVFALGFAGALATAVADTAGSEVGQLWGRRTFLVTTLRPVPRGTQGAVSLEGTVAGILASVVVAALGVAGGLFGPLGALVVVVAAFLGTLLESVVGATLERHGLLDNEGVNFLNTLMGALLAAGLGALAAGLLVGA
jgi:uncharacterized protein (TIGR00297 family)